MKQKKAFTLIELIVVITILSILGTIAFISLNGYTKTARDSTRISDLSTIKSGLELFHLDSGKYPITTNGFNVTYSGITVWNQGILGIETINNISRIDKTPLDPLTNKEYVYSVTTTMQEYQLAGIFEGNNFSLNNIYNKTSAGDKTAIAHVTGNYNGVLTKTNSGTSCEVLSVPSIISSSPETTTDLVTILANKSLVYNGFNNLPNNYINSPYKADGGFDFTSNKLIVYSDNNKCSGLYDNNSNISRITLIKNLQTAYSGTIIDNNDYIKDIISIDINNYEEVDLFSRSIVNNNLGGKLELGKKQERFGLPLDLTQIFSKDTERTSNWSNNICDTSLINVIEVGPGTDTIYNANGNSFTLADNTIYKLSEGKYITSGTLYVGNCGAIIGEGNIEFYSSVQLPYAILNTSAKDNIIIQGIKINGKNDGYGLEHAVNTYGVYTGIFSYDITFINLELSNNYRGLLSEGRYHLINNIISYNNDYIGIDIQSNYTNANNLLSYNNYSDNLRIRETSNSIFNYIETYNSASQYGLYLFENNNNIYSNIKTYSNARDGLFLAGGYNDVINNLESFNNNGHGVYIYATNLTPAIESQYNTVNNFNVYNNNSYGIINTYTGNVLNNGYVYNHSNVALKLQSSTYDSIFNNVKVYNNTGCGYTYCGGLFAYDTTVTKKYYGNIELFGNSYNQFDGLVSGSGSNIFTDGVLTESTNTMSCDYHSKPGNADWGVNCENIKAQTLTTPVSSYNYGIKIAKQTRPVRYNSNNELEFYGVDGVDYNSTKFIGQW